MSIVSFSMIASSSEDDVCLVKFELVSLDSIVVRAYSGVFYDVLEWESIFTRDEANSLYSSYLSNGFTQTDVKQGFVHLHVGDHIV